MYFNSTDVDKVDTNISTNNEKTNSKDKDEEKLHASANEKHKTKFSHEKVEEDTVVEKIDDDKKRIREMKIIVSLKRTASNLLLKKLKEAKNDKTKKILKLYLKKVTDIKIETAGKKEKKWLINIIKKLKK